MSKPNKFDNILNIGLIMYSCIGSQAHKLEFELEFELDIEIELGLTNELRHAKLSSNFRTF